MVGEMEAQKLRELDRPRKEANRKLGEGGYGEVYEGTYRNEPVGIVQNNIKYFVPPWYYHGSIFDKTPGISYTGCFLKNRPVVRNI